jgi:hypothetical protein
MGLEESCVEDEYLTVHESTNIPPVALWPGHMPWALLNNAPRAHALRGFRVH